MARKPTLSDDDIADVHLRYMRGESQGDIGKRYGVTQSYVAQLISGLKGTKRKKKPQTKEVKRHISNLKREMKKAQELADTWWQAAIKPVQDLIDDGESPSKEQMANMKLASNYQMDHLKMVKQMGVLMKQLGGETGGMDEETLLKSVRAELKRIMPLMCDECKANLLAHEEKRMKKELKNEEA